MIEKKSCDNFKITDANMNIPLKQNDYDRVIELILKTFDKHSDLSTRVLCDNPEFQKSNLGNMIKAAMSKVLGVSEQMLGDYNIDFTNKVKDLCLEDRQKQWEKAFVNANLDGTDKISFNPIFLYNEEFCIKLVGLGLLDTYGPVTEEMSSNFLRLIPNQTKKICDAAVEVHGRSLKLVKPPFNDDYDICQKAMSNCGSALKYAGENMRANMYVCLNAARSHAYFLKSNDFKRIKYHNPIIDNEDGYDSLENTKTIYEYHDFIKKNDKRFKTVLQYADESVLNNREAMLEAIKINWHEINNIGNKLRKDFEFFSMILQEFHIDSDALNDIASIFKYQITNDHRFVLEMVKIDWMLFETANERIRNDFEVCLAATDSNINALQYVGDNIKNDIDFFKTILYKNSDKLKDYDFAKTFFGYFKNQLRDNREFMLEAVKIEGFILQYGNDEIRNDPEICLIAVQNCGTSLQWASNEIRNNEKICLEAVRNNGMALEYVENQTPAICRAALDENENALCYVRDTNMVFDELKEESPIMYFPF